MYFFLDVLFGMFRYIFRSNFLVRFKVGFKEFGRLVVLMIRIRVVVVTLFRFSNIRYRMRGD